LVPITGIIGSNPNPRFVDLKLASDEAGLKAEAHLPQKELIRKDPFLYQLVVANITDRSALGFA
jgi:hypothetical protein